MNILPFPATPPLLSLYPPTIPNQRAILNTQILHKLRDLINLVHTLLQRRLCSKHSSMILHNLLHGQSNFRSRVATICIPHLVEVGNSGGSCTRGEWGMGGIGGKVVLDVQSTSTAKDDNVK